MAVLVTGGAGYIGSHVAKALKKKGFLPVVLDDLSAGHREAVKWGPFIQASLDDSVALKKAFIEYNPIAIMHFAASALVKESVENPLKYYENNVYGSLNLLKICLEADVENFIFSSSCASYGTPDGIPITEEMPQKPINPYGRSKLIVEWMLKDFERAYGLKSAILRYFNAAGADSEGEIGEDHADETHLIPLVIKTALQENPFLEIFGTDFPTPDGTAVRDYVHVEDLAEAHLLALLYLLKEKKGLELNLGTGKGHSVLEIIELTKNLTRKEIPSFFRKRREGDPPILVASNEKAKKLLNWQPKKDLEEIISSAYRWHSR